VLHQRSFKTSVSAKFHDKNHCSVSGFVVLIQLSPCMLLKILYLNKQHT